MVDAQFTGRGAGRALAERVLDWAREAGFRAMQFNAVVETNERAVRLWRSLGFEAPERYWSSWSRRHSAGGLSSRQRRIFAP